MILDFSINKELRGDSINFIKQHTAINKEELTINQHVTISLLYNQETI